MKSRKKKNKRGVRARGLGEGGQVRGRKGVDKEGLRRKGLGKIGGECRWVACSLNPTPSPTNTWEEA